MICWCIMNITFLKHPKRYVGISIKLIFQVSSICCICRYIYIYICMYIYICIYIYISEAVVSFRWRSGNIFLLNIIACSFYAVEYNLLRLDNTTPSKQTISNYPPRWREGGWGVNNSAMRGRWPIRFMENRFSSLIMNAYRAYRREFIFCVKWTVFDIPKI